jgi:hypothetical protein
VRRSSCLAALAIALSVVVSPAAWADDSVVFFAQGRSLRLDGKCGEAVVAFRKALELKPDGLGSLRNIAECEEELGLFASARADWWRLRGAALDTTEPKYAGWSEHGMAGYKRLEAKVPRLTVVLSGAALERVRVTVDGQPLNRDLVGTELERDPGPHAIEASYGGVAPIRAERTLAPGAREVVTLVIPDEEPKAASAARAGPSAGTLRTAGFIALGAGVLGGVATAVAAAVRGSAVSTVEQACPGGTCATPADLTNGNSAVSRGKAASTALDVLIPFTVAGAGAGVALIVVGSLPRAPSVPVEVALRPSAGGARLCIGGRF